VTGKYAFPRQERLRTRREYLRVYGEGAKWVGPAFICYVARGEGQDRKFGFAVSQKVGKAVVRNRVKRYLREIYRTHRPYLAGDAQLVIVARAPSAKLDFHQSRDAVRRLFRKGGVLSE
jgi:ribonuclease P protein component